MVEEVNHHSNAQKENIFGTLKIQRIFIEMMELLAFKKAWLLLPKHL